jgi:hypothetical protein
MIVQVSRTDENGLYKEPVLLEEGQEVPINCIVDIVPEGLYLPKWDGTQWVEGLTLEAINRLKNTVLPPSQEDRIKSLEDALLMLMGV